MDFRGKHIDLVGKQNLWFGISAVVILIGLVSLFAFGLNYGIDFKGGGQLKYLIPAAQRPAAGQDVTFLNTVREALAPKGLENSKIQISGGDTLVIVTDATSNDSLQSQEKIIDGALKTQFGAQPQVVSRELVGPVIGKELKRNAFLGVIFGVLFIALWIYIRYNFAGDGMRYAVAGIMALVHDVFVLVGLMALVGHFDPRIEVDGSFIAALLTVVGYSINDSVVIFDRIRENLRTRRREDFNHVVNDSLLETMSRSVNTGMTVIIMLLVMLFLGGESIYNFILAMLIGIATGLYSSIFNASMVLTAWHQLDLKKALTSAGTRRTTAPAGAAATIATPTTPPSAPSPRASTPLASDSATAKSPDAPAAQRPHKARSKRRF
jgi:preprotein translocase subunit SecF